jgi:myo-inositol 2-dehydrogenase / D-chiro-inositol 1-dehydrogenase
LPLLRIALIGCGRIAQLVHLRALTSLPEVEVVALADAHLQRLEEAHRLVPAAQTYGDYRALLASSNADAVVVAVPPNLHAEVAVAAFAAGKHVYLEKPGATSEEDVVRVMHAWRSAGTVGMIGLNQRFHPMYTALRHALLQERVGDIVAIRSVFSAAPRGLPPWKQHRASGGGVMLDLALHHVDLLRFVFDDEVAEVTALLRSLRSENDTAVISLRLGSGPIAQIFVSMTTSAQDSLDVYGTAGRITADRYGSGRLAYAPTKRRSGRAAQLTSLGLHATQQLHEIARPLKDPSHGLAFRAFAAAVGGNAPERLPTPEDAFRSLAVVFAAEASMNQPFTTPADLPAGVPLPQP